MKPECVKIYGCISVMYAGSVSMCHNVRGTTNYMQRLASWLWKD